MKQQLCELIVNFPTVTILGLTALAVLCLFSVPGTVCFLGIFCLLIRSVQKGREQGWIRETEPPPDRRRPRHRTPAPEYGERRDGAARRRTQAPSRR